MKKFSDEYFMKEALREARKAYKKNEVPIGAVIVLENKIISKGHNLRETKSNPLYHAEIIAIDKAAKKLKKRRAANPSQANGSWRLLGAKLYVTIEPCPMCIGAIINARIGELVYGAKDPKAGACGSAMNIPENEKLNHRVKIKGKILEEESKEIIQCFFKEKRKRRAFGGKNFFSGNNYAGKSEI